MDGTDLEFTFEEIKKSFPSPNPNRVRELKGTLTSLTEADSDELRQRLNQTPDKCAYDVRYCFNKEEDIAYIHIRRVN